MNRNSIDVIVRAKKQLQRRQTINILGVCALIINTLSVFLFNIPVAYFTAINYGLIAAVFLNNGDFKIFGLDMVSRAQLINIIEDQINHDAETIQTMANTNS